MVSVEAGHVNVCTSYWPLAKERKMWSVTHACLSAVGDVLCIYVQQFLYSLVKEAIWNVDVLQKGCVR